MIEKRETLKDRNLERYLRPTRLCDFDLHPEIAAKAGKLTRRKKGYAAFKIVFNYVKELPYGLEDWNLKASETLKKGWGMCSGKSNLLIAMLRSLGIPTRYRVYKIYGDNKLREWFNGEAGNLEATDDAVMETADHVTAEVYLNGRWEEHDPSRDPDYEAGLLRLGIPLERRLLPGPKGKPEIRRLASFDRWAEKRQSNRHYRDNRVEVFTWMNRGFEKIRLVGKSAVVPQLKEIRRND